MKFGHREADCRGLRSILVKIHSFNRRGRIAMIIFGTESEPIAPTKLINIFLAGIHRICFATTTGIVPFRLFSFLRAKGESLESIKSTIVIRTYSWNNPFQAATRTIELQLGLNATILSEKNVSRRYCNSIDSKDIFLLDPFLNANNEYHSLMIDVWYVVWLVWIITAIWVSTFDFRQYPFTWNLAIICYLCRDRFYIRYCVSIFVSTNKMN